MAGGDVADEPSTSELARRIDEIRADLRDVIGRPEYTADLRAFRGRAEDIGRELGDLRAGHDLDIRGVQERIDAEAKRAADSRQGWRTLIYTGLIPSLIALGAILVQIWLNGSGK